MLVQVDTDEASIGRFLPAEIGIRGDAREVAEALVAELERRGHAFTGFRFCDDTRDSIASYRKDAEVHDRSTATRIDPRTLMLALDRMLPRDRCCA